MAMEEAAAAESGATEEGDEVEFARNAGKGSDYETAARLAAAKKRETAAEVRANILNHQLNDVQDIASARPSLVEQALEAVSRKLEEGLVHREQYEAQQPHQHLPERIEGRPVPDNLSEAVESVDGGISAMTGTTERQPAGGRPETKSFFDEGIGHGERQHEEIPDKPGSSFATTGVVAAVCTLLAMLLVGALVWVHVREILQRSRTGKGKRRTTEEEAKRSKSTSREKGSRTEKTPDWDGRRQGHEKATLSQKKERAEGRETLFAEDRENFAGGFWPAREGRSSSTARRAGAFQQPVRPAVGEQHQQREDERDVQRKGECANQWYSEQKESREAEKEMERAQREKSQQRQQPRGLCPEMVADDGENSTSSLSIDDGFGNRFQQSKVGETTEECVSAERSRGRRNVAISYHVEEPQWHRLHSAVSNSDEDGAVRSTCDVTYSRREEVRGYVGSSSSSPAAQGGTRDIYEEGAPDISSSFSVKEEENMLSPSELEDQVSPTPDQYPTQSGFPWFSMQGESARSSAAIVSLQRQYEKKCRDLFARLGEVVEEAPVKAQTPPALKEEADKRQGTASRSAEGTLKTSSGNGEQQRRHEEEPFRFERPAPLSEEAMTEAEQLLTHLEEMFADIKRDFKDNQPGNITCMIRCCNRLLEMDGLMVLSRCKKVPRLTQKAQSVIETVVPCIWSS